MKTIVRIGTRKSRLALEQTRIISELLKEKAPELTVEYITRDTIGDQILDSPLQSFGGKGVFVSEFEQAMREGVMDLAVHSAKDLPMELESGLVLAAVSKREDPRDVLVTVKGTREKNVSRFLVGTSSLRRKLQMERGWEAVWKEQWKREENAPKLHFGDLRGNVNTRLEKLKEGKFQGIILAAAGLLRLGIEEGEEYDFTYLPPEQFIPAGGQGIMAVEGKEGSTASRLCRLIDDEEGRICLEFERSVLRGLDAGCHEPVGIYSRITGDRFEVWGINRRDGKIREIHLTGKNEDGERRRLAGEAVKGLK